MQIEITASVATEVLCDALVLTLFEDVLIPNGITGKVDAVLSGHIQSIMHEQPDCAKYGMTTVMHTWGAIGAKQVILLGVGKKEEVTLDKMSALSASVMRVARKLNAKSVASIVYGTEVEEATLQARAQAIVEGALLGTYQFNYYKTEKKVTSTIEKLILIETESTSIEKMKLGANKAQIIAQSVNLARDLVNHPSQYMTPSKMAWHATEIAKQTGLELTILDREDMKKEEMQALLAVAQGSEEPPKMIVLKYNGNTQSKEYTAFVGKGITFDSGGISLKPSEKMGEMKGDMAGGAAVLGAMLAIGQLKPAVNVLGIVPCTENMPSGHAYKPGDVISSMSGKTIEIMSTDAEGRLILADAVTYAYKKLGANKIVDLATLTGACVVALGTTTSGVVTNDANLCQQVLTAATETGEKMWEMPNFDEYKEQNKSSIADLKNTGGRGAGMITAGLFIGEFVGKTPWVHIDIAGTSDTEKTKGYQVKGGTGAGVKTLIRLAQNMEKQ